MIMKNKIFILNKILQEKINFEELGFSLFCHKENYYELHRASNDKIDYLEYRIGLDKYKETGNLSPIDCRMIFPRINKILLELNNINNLIGTHLSLEQITLNSYPNYENKIDYYGNKLKVKEFIKNRIFNEPLFEEALEIFKEQLHTNVLPFFDKIQSLQQVNDEILEKVDWNTYHKYISGETGAKVLIIMKLCNNTRFEAYKERSDKLIAEQLKDANFIQYKDVLEKQQKIMDEVYNYLNSDKHLEIV